MRKTKENKDARKKLAEAFGQRLRGMLDERGWSVETLLSKNAALKWPTIQRYREGVNFPKPRTLVDLAVALDCKSQELIDGLKVPTSFRVEVDAIDAALRRN